MEWELAEAYLACIAFGAAGCLVVVAVVLYFVFLRRKPARVMCADGRLDVMATVYAHLLSLGCHNLRVHNGIVTVTAPDGSRWDFTVPRRMLEKFTGGAR